MATGFNLTDPLKFGEIQQSDTHKLEVTVFETMMEWALAPYV
jgi:hypothetical protein